MADERSEDRDPDQRTDRLSDTDKALHNFFDTANREIEAENPGSEAGGDQQDPEATIVTGPPEGELAQSFPGAEGAGSMDDLIPDFDPGAMQHPGDREGTSAIDIKKLEDLVGETVFGNYVIERKLGQGAQGEVYLAWDQGLQVYRAVKALRTANDEVLQRFISEARALEEARHKNIAEVVFFNYHEGTPLLVTELLDHDLKERLAIEYQMGSEETPRGAWSLMRSAISKIPEEVTGWERTKQKGGIVKRSVGSALSRTLKKIKESVYLPYRAPEDESWGVHYAVELIRVLANGLHNGPHRVGIYHRDIKPENIMFRPQVKQTKQGEFNAHLEGYSEAERWGYRVIPFSHLQEKAVLTDLGLVKRVDADQDEENKVMGTPTFMAPEQAMAWNELVDARTDVYGLAASLYQMLTAQVPKPFQKGMDITSYLAMIAEDIPIRPASMLNPQVDEELWAVIEKALAFHQDRRHQSAGELAEDLSNWQYNHPVSPFDTRSERARKFVHRNSPVVVPVTLGALALLGVGANVMAERSEATSQIKGAIASYADLPDTTDVAAITSAQKRVERAKLSAEQYGWKEEVDRLQGIAQTLENRLAKAEIESRNHGYEQRAKLVQRTLGELDEHSADPSSYDPLLRTLDTMLAALHDAEDLGSRSLEQDISRVREQVAGERQQATRQRSISALAAQATGLHERVMSEYRDARGLVIHDIDLSEYDKKIKGAQEHLDEARRSLSRWVDLAPDNAQAKGFLLEIERASYDLQSRQRAEAQLYQAEQARARGDLKQALMSTVKAYGLANDSSLEDLIPSLVEQDKVSEQTRGIAALLTVFEQGDQLYNTFFDFRMGKLDGVIDEQDLRRYLAALKQRVGERLREPSDDQLRQIALPSRTYERLMEAYDQVATKARQRVENIFSREEVREYQERILRQRRLDQELNTLDKRYLEHKIDQKQYEHGVEEAWRRYRR